MNRVVIKRAVVVEVLGKICRKFVIAFFTLTLSLSAVAGEIVGKVTKVSDGDTIWVATDSGLKEVKGVEL